MYTQRPAIAPESTTWLMLTTDSTPAPAYALPSNVQGLRTDIESTPPAGGTIELKKTGGSQQRAALMKRTTKYVGLDVHQSATVASVRQENGRVIARAILPTEEHALLEFFGGMRGSIRVTFEEGTQAQWLHDLLLPQVGRIAVLDEVAVPPGLEGQSLPGLFFI